MVNQDAYSRPKKVFIWGGLIISLWLMLIFAIRSTYELLGGLLL